MQAFRFAVVAMMLLLQKPAKVSAAEPSGNNCEALAQYNPAKCNDEPQFEYNLSVSCTNETTVSVSFQEPAGNKKKLELVTMQYSCYNATTDEGLTHAFTYESEILSDEYNLSNHMFSQGTCLFTGCAIKTRLPCWLYITEAVNISCGTMQDQNNPSPSLSPSPSPSFTPSSIFNTITVSPTTTSFGSNIDNLQSSVITRPDVSRKSNSPFLPSTTSHLLGAASSFHSPLPSNMAANDNNVPTLQSKDDPLPPKNPANYDIVIIIASVAVLLISLVSLIGLFLSFLACRRFYRKMQTRSSFYAKDTESAEEGNIYVDKFGKLEYNDNIAKGSILTLVQQLNYNNKTSADGHHTIIPHGDNTMLLKGDELFLCDHKVPVLRSSLSNSCHSLPDKTGIMTRDKPATQYSSQYLTRTNCYLTFEDARLISESSCEADTYSSSSSSLQEHNDVFTKDSRGEKELKPSSFVIQSHPSTSSGYLSTSPRDDEQVFDRIDGRQCSMDQDYIYDMLPPVVSLR